MGFNQNTTHCDLAVFENEGVAGISAIFGSKSLEREQTEGGSLVDLKLGRFTDFGEGLANSYRVHKTSPMDPFSSAGSSKRARAPSSGSQIVSCLVDGCKADLSKCRDYHRRHKVCEMHSKTPRVTIGGHERRFCQQCSRFHPLGEFDEGKRSCRKRLEGHNRRRRKPQPEPMPMNPGSFLSASQGSRFLPFSSPPIISASSIVNTNWSRAVKSESDASLYNSPVSGLYSQAYRGRPFPFLPVPESPLSGVSSAGQTLHLDGSSSGNDSQKLFCNGLNQVIDSDRALSLLSSSSAETCEMGLGRIVHPNPPNPARPMLAGLPYNSLAPYPGSQTQGFEGQSGGSGLLSNMRSSNSFCQDVFQGGSGGSSGSGGHQTISFSWE